jgi:hypothetical protein
MELEMKPEANILNKLKKSTRRITRNVKPRRSSGNDYVTNNYLDAKLETLEYKMDIKFARLTGEMDAKFSKMDIKFAQVDTRFAQVDTRFAQVDTKISQAEKRMLIAIGSSVVANCTIILGFLQAMGKL